jgi:hypothetical protein
VILAYVGVLLQRDLGERRVKQAGEKFVGAGDPLGHRSCPPRDRRSRTALGCFKIAVIAERIRARFNKA